MADHFKRNLSGLRLFRSWGDPAFKGGVEQGLPEAAPPWSCPPVISKPSQILRADSWPGALP